MVKSSRVSPDQRVHVQVEYRNSLYEMDVNAHDTVHTMLYDLYHSILKDACSFSFMEKILHRIRFETRSYQVWIKKEDVFIQVNPSSLVKNAYYKFE